MRRYFIILFVAISFAAQAQKEKSCFIDYYELFTKRGCLAIPDGLQNVIITVRDTKANTCFSIMGKVEVKNNMLNGPVKLVNRSGELVQPSKVYPKTTKHEGYNNPESKLKFDRSIKNGITSNFLTQDMKVVNFFFIDYLKPPSASIAEPPPAKKL